MLRGVRFRKLPLEWHVRERAITFLCRAFAAQMAAGGDRLIMWGAKVNELIDQGQCWRFVTSNFLHSGIPHLLVSNQTLQRQSDRFPTGMIGLLCRGLPQTWSGVRMLC